MNGEWWRSECREIAALANFRLNRNPQLPDDHALTAAEVEQVLLAAARWRVQLRRGRWRRLRRAARAMGSGGLSLEAERRGRAEPRRLGRW